MQKLPSALISLVHHVQLNQSGWWNAAIERLILATLWTSNGLLHATALPNEIRRLFEVNVSGGALQGAVQRLKNRDELISSPDGSLKITEARMVTLQDERRGAERLVASVRSIFCDALKQEGLVATDDTASPDSLGVVTVDPNKAWDDFENLWLLPTVCTAGARTYELINGDYSQWTRAKDIEPFLEQFPEETHGQLQRALEHFLNPGNADVRAFILRLMDGYFVVEASQLDAGTVSRLSELTGQHPSFTVFLDTNFLLSLLGVHDEGAQAAAEALVQLPRSLEGRVNVRLQVLAATMDETRSALQRELRGVEGVRMSAPVAKTVMRSAELTGMAGAYLRAAAKSDQALTARSVFEPYIQSLAAILNRWGITVAAGNLDEIKRRPEVVADVDAQLAAQARSPATRAKHRITIEHDVGLWHYVNGKRAPRVDTPSDAGYWIVTEDGRFAAFDQYKQAASGTPSVGRVPICLQPLALVQLLQFWLGRTERVEEALVGAFRLSMLSRSFDPASEKATITILQAISRYENVDDLTPDTITHLLMNDALRARLGQVENVDEREQLVRDELLAEYRKMSEELERAQVAQLTANARIDAHRLEANATVQNERERRERAEERLAEKEQSEKRLSDRLELLEANTARRDFRARWVLLPLVLAAAVVVAISIYTGRNGIPFNWRFALPLCLAVGWVWAAAVGWRFKNDASVTSYGLYKFIVRGKGGLSAFVVAIAYGILGNLATESWWKPIANDAMSAAPVAPAPAAAAVQDRSQSLPSPSTPATGPSSDSSGVKLKGAGGN